MHAFERLMKLGIKGKQEHDIIYVLLDCCTQEKDYNPFYSFLAKKLCEYHRYAQLCSFLRVL